MGNILFIFIKYLEIFIFLFVRMGESKYTLTDCPALRFLCVFKIFIENRFFYHPIHPDHNFLSLHLSQIPHLPSSSDPLPLHFLFWKEQSSKRWQPSRTKIMYNKTRKKPSYYGQANPIGGKKNQERITESETHPLSVRSPTINTKLKAIKQMQRKTQEGFMFAV